MKLKTGIMTKDRLNNFKNLIVVSSEPLNGRMELIYNMIYKLSKNKSIQIFNYDGNNQWFTENLIASISQIDKYKISAFFNPCEVVGKIYKDFIDIQRLNNTIKLLQERDIIMVDFVSQIISKDYLDYLLDYAQDVDIKPRDVYIINTIDSLLKRTNYSKETVVKKLSNFAKINHIEIILIADSKYTSKEKLELNNIVEYETIDRYAKKVILSKRLSKELLTVLDFNQFKKSITTKTFKINFDTKEIREVK